MAGSFCRGCGLPVDELEVRHPKDCTRDGPIAADDRLHCEHCGAKLPVKGASPCPGCGKKATRIWGK